MEHCRNYSDGGKNQVLGLKPVSVPLYPPQIPHEHSRFCVKEYKKEEAKKRKRKNGKELNKQRKKDKEKGTRKSKK
jgi:hypothetical protein